MRTLSQKVTERTRQVALIAGGAGAAAVGVIGISHFIGISGVVADVALSMAALATIAGWSFLRSNHDPEPTPPAPHERTSRRYAIASYTAPVVITAVGVAAASSWFHPGTALAGGDIAPPQGLAWIGHLFAPWSGTDLGGPNGLVAQLPWAAVLEAVHWAGGSAPLAQQVWLTGLFVSMGLGGYLLLRVLGLAPFAAAAGALAYLFNPYTVSMVGINAVYLAAMALLPVLAAITFSAVTGRLAVRGAAVLLALTSPLIGYVYANPPLVLLLVAGTLFAGGYGLAVGGHAARGRAIRFGLLGLPLVAAACAYWAVPMLIQSGTVAGPLTHTSSWAWTEGRATLANGLWLNTTWGWSYPAYYPYAPYYSTFPLEVVKYFLPAMAFAAVPISFARSGRTPLRRLAVAAASVAALLIFVGTGTRPPGNVVFQPVYHLPYGWLLREPGRFLMGAALAYSVLLGISAERLASIVTHHHLHLRSPRHPWSALRGSAPAWTLGAVGMIVLIAPAYPLAFGQLTSKGTKVALPRYWDQMASYINHSPVQGSVLVLPSDDFYQMPYKWGYYGNDGFITQLLSRSVIDPAGQGYEATAAQLLTSVQVISADLAGGDWSGAQPILNALDTRMVLVRGDVLSSFPGRNIDSPVAINLGLRRDPRATLAHRDGPLSLYLITAPQSGPIITVNSARPDLNVLSFLPSGTRLISSHPEPGMPELVQPPPLTSWHLNGNSLSTRISIRPAKRYRVLAIPPWSAESPSHLQRKVTGSGPWRLEVHGLTSAILSARLGANQVTDGSFQSGLWQPAVGNCNAVAGQSAPSLSAELIPGLAPGGRPAMRLHAATGSACEATPVRHGRGTLLLSALIDDRKGAPANLCLWEQGLNRCATLTSPMPQGRGWKHYETEVTIDPGTRALTLFVYAAAPESRGYSTTIYYADISIHQTPPYPVIVTRLTGVYPKRVLRVVPVGFGSYWTGPGGDHVRVDGLLDGWLGTRTEIRGSLRYRYEMAFRGSQYASLAAAGASIVLGMWLWGTRVLRRRKL